MATITFNNGTSINVEVNGTTFISDVKPAFPSDLSNINITGCDFMDHVDYGRIVEAAGSDNRYWFGIIPISEKERAETQLRADVDYIMMELDIE